jgi:hypothetical protein
MFAVILLILTQEELEKKDFTAKAIILDTLSAASVSWPTIVEEIALITQITLIVDVVQGAVVPQKVLARDAHAENPITTN